MGERKVFEPGPRAWPPLPHPPSLPPSLPFPLFLPLLPAGCCLWTPESLSCASAPSLPSWRATSSGRPNTLRPETTRRAGTDSERRGRAGDRNAWLPTRRARRLGLGRPPFASSLLLSVTSCPILAPPISRSYKLPSPDEIKENEQRRKPPPPKASRGSGGLALAGPRAGRACAALPEPRQPSSLPPACAM